MREASQDFIIDLLRGKESPASITGYIRRAFVEDKTRIEELANNLHKMPGYEKKPACQNEDCTGKDIGRARY